MVLGRPGHDYTSGISHTPEVKGHEYDKTGRENCSVKGEEDLQGLRPDF